MNWSFAIVNNRLAEIFFDEKTKKIFAHCYVDRKNYKTKQEQKTITEDIKKVRITWRNKKYIIIKPQVNKRAVKKIKAKKENRP
ncbi:MAG: hypothetical protein AAB779_00670 [Patescibacteria group bacterium]